MSVLQLTVTDDDLLSVELRRGVSTQKNYMTCELSFGDTWQGYQKTAIFFQDKANKYHVVLTGDTVTVPWEATKQKGVMYVGVFGMKDDKVRPTNFAYTHLVEGTYGAGNIPSPPTPDVYQQILDYMNETADYAGRAEQAKDGAEQAAEEAEAARDEMKPGEWITPTITNPNVRIFEPIQYRKNVNIIQFRGSIGIDERYFYNIFSLPEGFRPVGSSNVFLDGYADGEGLSEALISVLQINGDGSVSLQAMNGDNFTGWEAFVSFNACSFPIDE